MVMGRCGSSPSTRRRSSAIMAPPRTARAAQRAALARLEPAHHCAPPAIHPLFPSRGVAHPFGPVERRAQHGSIGDLAAVAAGHAAIVHMGHRVGLERVAAVLERERRAARQAHAGVVATAHGCVHTEFFLDHTFTPLDRRRNLRLHAALLVEHAFALGDHHLGALEVGGQRLLQGGLHRVDVVGVVHGAHPLHAHAAHRCLDRVLGAAVLVVDARGQQVLPAGGSRVVVVHDHDHAVGLVEHRIADAAGQAVVPETAVTHHRDRAFARCHVECGRAGRPQAVAHGGRAQVERRHGREQVAADVARDVVHAELLPGPASWPRRWAARGNRHKSPAGAAAPPRPARARPGASARRPLRPRRRAR